MGYFYNDRGHRRAGAKLCVFFLVVFFGVTGALQAAPKTVKLIEFWDDREPDSLMQVRHDVWQQILDKYLNDQHPSGINRFDYEKVTVADRIKLTGYLDYLQRLDPRQLNSAEAQAYWINLFNARLVSLVVEAFESDTLKSIREIRSGVFTAGPWERESIQVAQQELSLDDVEQGILRPIWKDHRVHYALSFACIGGANLQKTAFDGENNETLLAKAEKEYLSHQRAVRIDDDELVLSSIFDWYGADFADGKDALVAYLKQHVSPELAAAINSSLDFKFEYDWALNKPE